MVDCYVMILMVPVFCKMSCGVIWDTFIGAQYNNNLVQVLIQQNFATYSIILQDFLFCFLVEWALSTFNI